MMSDEGRQRVIDAIMAMLALANRLGWRVWYERGHIEPGHVGGRCHYPDEPRGPLIEVAADIPEVEAWAAAEGYTLEELDAAIAVESGMVLAHELGHALSWLRRGGCLPAQSSARERLAYLLGWAVVRRSGLPVTRAEWRKHHPAVVQGLR